MTGPAVIEPDATESLFSLPGAAQLYVAAVIAAGVLCVILAVPQVDVSAPLRLAAVLLVGLATASIHLPLPLAHGQSSMSISHAVVLFALLTIGTAGAVIVAVATTLVQSTVRTRSRSRPYRVLFNVASLALTVALAGGAYYGLRADQGNWLDTFAGPLACAELVYFAANTLLIATAVALTTRQSLSQVWLADFLWIAPGNFVGAVTAGLAFTLSGRSLYWWVAIAVPLYLTYQSYRTYVSRVTAGQAKAQQALEVQFAIVQALAAAIESKDRTSQFELQRLTVYAEALGKAVGLDENELHAVRTAALLHDIGNLAVPEHILAKSSPLTFEEFDRVKIHARVGADILKGIPFTVPVAPLVLGHHERWDGSGYPAGLKGTAIPLGARILAVADCFSALLSDRPYRPAFPYWEALATLKRCSGTWLDPGLVERFVEILPDLEAALKERMPDAGPSALAWHSEPTVDQAFEDIAVARHEARALFEIAQALTSTHGIAEAVDTIVGKLAALMPIDGGALFLWNEDQARLSCRYATGAARARVAAIAADSPERLQSELEEAVASSTAPAIAVLLARLTIGDRLLGALVIVGPPHGSRNDHQRLLEHVAPQVGLVINNAIAFEETRQLSLTDPLTELPNRRYLVQHLGLELARADRHGCQVALLLMDVDDFKDINDTHGHGAGDMVLCAIGRVTRSLLRPYDVCARYGGDEFVLVLWDCDAAQADRRRQQLEETIAKTAAPIEGLGPSLASVSIGIAVYPVDGHRTDAMLAVADQRMYARKAVHRAARLRPRDVEMA